MDYKEPEKAGMRRTQWRKAQTNLCQAAPQKTNKTTLNEQNRHHTAQLETETAKPPPGKASIATTNTNLKITIIMNDNDTRNLHNKSPKK